MGDATENTAEAADNDDIYAYPNPASHYEGLITIHGLSYNSDVKIVTSSGKLIAQGRSNGGTFTWDGRDQSGRRVASGVYTALTATQDGKKSGVCRIAIIN
jgi:flagellar hook assembly protein FlgD